MDLKKYKDSLLFIPLGGANEIGMNFNVYHYQGKYLIIDCGIGFADEYYPGIDIVLPNIDFIANHKKDIVGMIITHAHEDHLGGVPYLWNELECKVYATPFCANVLREKIKGMPMSNIPIVEVVSGGKVNLKPFDVEFVNITHSIPEMQGLIIRTDRGTVVHTGDWKLDENPLVGELTDEARLTEIGNEDVLAMVCDSTNVFVEGTTGSESGVREELTELIKSCKNRVAVTTFASNVARLETIIKAGTDAGRKICLAGRSLFRILAAAQSAGYLQDIPELIDDRTAMSLPRKDVLFICTGCQGEPMAATAKIANKEHHSIKFAPDDTFIFSSRMIPGNDKKISWVQNKMVLNGIEVINSHKDNNIHVSGHPARDELRRMYEMVRPKIAIPVHGEARHIHEHANFAKSLGIKHAIEPQNGVVIELADTGAKIVGNVESGYIVVDGGTMMEAGSSVMVMRRRIKNQGIIIVSVGINKHREITFEPIISAPGTLDNEIDADLIDAIKDEIIEEIIKLATAKKFSAQIVKDGIQQAARRIFRKEIDKKPVVEVHLIME